MLLCSSLLAFAFADGFEPCIVRARKRVWVRFANYATHEKPPGAGGESGQRTLFSLSSLAANLVQASALLQPGTRSSLRIGDLSEQSSCLTRILRRRLLNLFVEFHDAAS